MQAAGTPASAQVTACPVVTVYPQVCGRTPRRIGFNVEVQTDADRLNLWDWLADSGATIVREFHPEVNMRRTPVKPGKWGRIRNRADFDAFRARCVRNPLRTVDFANYRFSEEMPYLGTPDKIIGHLRDAGMAAMIPMGYVPTMFPRPLVRNPDNIEPADDGRIDWEAAASAYEYYFAMAHHFASGFGCRFFMLVNEPEYRFGGFYLPKDVRALGNSLFDEVFIKLRDVALWNRYFKALAVQVSVMARIARQALDDVRSALPVRHAAGRLLLSGPVSGNLDVYWPGVRPYVDFCDYHQYSPHPEAYRERFRRAAELVRGTGKDVVISEFNRQAGEMPVSGMYFTIAESIGFARIMMEIMQMGEPGGPVVEAATMYHFHFPATHRNYKSLVFGDMNRVDWTGVDARPSGAEMHPTVEELQIRAATPAYHMFRMLARAAGCSRGSSTPHPVLRTSMMIRDTALVPDLADAIRVLAVEAGDRLVVTLLNSHPAGGDTVTLDISGLRRRYGWAVVRETRLEHWDKAVAEAPTREGKMQLALPPRSMVQVVFSNIDPAEVRSARIVEDPRTLGRCASLGLLQTTRLRLTAEVKGRRIDLTGHNVVWESEDDQFVRVGQGGLVQRVRSTARTIRISARLVDGTRLAEIAVPPDRQG
jgi:hypothetical protein